MCRFLTYSGPATTMAALILDAELSLVVQSKSAEKRKIPTNADGFGVGWYPLHDDPEPATFVSIEPVWSNRNLKVMANKVLSGHYFAHVRDASLGMPVTPSNCHPFQCMNYLWMHNGRLDQFDTFRRGLLNLLSERAFHLIQGNTDSEYAFALFMDILGFKENASAQELGDAMKKTILRIMLLRKEYGANTNAFLNFAVSDGKNTIVTRFATDEKVRPASLFFTKGKLHSQANQVEIHATNALDEQCVIVCSEPLTRQKNKWIKVERNHMVIANGNAVISQAPIDLPFQYEL
ncbi:class II glutamine amidotransferase [Pseudomonadota bacterium]